jgi:hypothetical protein
VTIVAGLPLMMGRALSGHDIVVYLINAQQTAQNLRAGEVLPAWGGGFNAGFGAPTLLFFPPLTSYLHAMPVLLGVPVIVGVSAWSLVGLWLSGLAMYGWLNSAGFRSSAVVASAAYMLAPYRFVDLYTRSALAEHWSFVWPPLILWVATAPGLRAATRVSLVGFSVAALLLTNIPLATFFGAGLAVWFTVSKQINEKRAVVLGGAALGFLIAAFALVPQALSSSLLAVDQYYGPAAGRFRPSVNTLFHDGLVWNFNAQMSLLLVASFVFVLLGFVLLSRERRSLKSVLLVVIASGLCVLAAVQPMGLVWDALPLLSRFQFPWRLASLLVFALAFMVAHLERRRGWLLVGLVVATSVPYAGWNRTVSIAAVLSPEPARPSAASVFPNPHSAWEAGSNGRYWRHESLAEIWFLATNQRPFLLPELAGNHAPQLDFIRSRPAVVQEHPSSPVEVIHWQNTRRVISVNAEVSGTLMWRVISFPKMVVAVDGQRVVVRTDPTTGLLVHPIPVGRHEVTWTWEPFPALWCAQLCSLSGVLCGVALLFAGLVRRQSS